MSSYDPFNRPGGGQRPDPFKDARKQMDDFRNNFQGRSSSLLWLVLVVLGVFGVMTSYYQVEAGHRGVILRLGEHIGTTQPGLHFKLPFWIDEVFHVPVEKIHNLEFGFRTVQAGIQSEFDRDRRALAESEMLTGDKNVATVEWTVQFRVHDPYKYLFRFRNEARTRTSKLYHSERFGVESTLRLMSEAAMRSAVGDHSFDELMTEGRAEIAGKAREHLNALNETYDTGITIVRLELNEVNAPDPVKPALREVEEAKQERVRMKHEADEDYNRAIPKALGQAKEGIQEAEGYAKERINRAKGDAERFKELQVAYRRAPDVTRTRLYLEAMDKILPRVKRKIVVDSNTKGLLPLLHLGQEAKQ